MGVLYDYPQEFEGKKSNLQALFITILAIQIASSSFRFGIIHCIADSGVYGLLTKGTHASILTILGSPLEEP